MENKQESFRNLLLLLAMILAAAVMAVSFLQYRNARSELSALKKNLEESTARWQQINEDKLVVQRELKAAKNNLREAELTIEESEERAAELREEIAVLEQEIEALRNAAP